MKRGCAGHREALDQQERDLDQHGAALVRALEEQKRQRK